jgi:hypothetical protein
MLDTARTVLAASGLTGAFWSCTTENATQVSKQIFIKHLGGDPAILLTGKKPSMSQFHPSECKAFPYVDGYFETIPKCKVKVSMTFIAEMQQHIICNITRYGPH